MKHTKIETGIDFVGLLENIMPGNNATAERLSALKASIERGKALIASGNVCIENSKKALNN